MSWTLLQLRQEFARSLDSLVTGTVTGGTTATLVDSLLASAYADDHFNGAEIYISDTTDDLAPKGQLRYVSDYTGSSGTFTVPAVFTAAPAAGDTYDVYLRTTKEELDHALMRAVEDQRLSTSLTIVSTTAEYTVTATGLHTAAQVRSISSRSTSQADERYTLLPPESYRFWDNAGVVTVEFDTAILDETLTLRIEYVARYDPLNSGSFADSTVIGGDLNRHIMYGKFYFYERRMVGASGATWDRYSALYQEVLARITASGEQTTKRSSKAKMQRWEPPRREDRYGADNIP